MDNSKIPPPLKIRDLMPEGSPSSPHRSKSRRAQKRVARHAALIQEIAQAVWAVEASAKALLAQQRQQAQDAADPRAALYRQLRPLYQAQFPTEAQQRQARFDHQLQQLREQDYETVFAWAHAQGLIPAKHEITLHLNSAELAAQLELLPFPACPSSPSSVPHR